jgi:hypothetical protein
VSETYYYLECSHIFIITAVAFKFRESAFVPRTQASYDYHCSLLDGPLSCEDSVTYGINFRSPLNDLQYFHVADMQLPQDIMHVLFEGVIPYEMKLLLTEFVSHKKYFTISYLNERINCFQYSPDESADKPNSLRDELFKPGSTYKFHYSGNVMCLYPCFQIQSLHGLVPRLNTRVARVQYGHF